MSILFSTKVSVSNLHCTMHPIITASHAVQKKLRQKATSVNQSWEEWCRKDMYYHITENNEVMIASLWSSQMNIFFASSLLAVISAIEAAFQKDGFESTLYVNARAASPLYASLYLENVVQQFHGGDSGISVIQRPRASSGPFLPIRIGLEPGYPTGPVAPSPRAAWGEAGVRISSSPAEYTLEWDRPLAMASTSALEGHDLLLFLEVNGQMLLPGTARWNKLGYYGDNRISKIESDTDWQMIGSVFLAEFVRFPRHLQPMLSEDWNSVHNALKTIFAKQQVTLQRH